jgi:hypothetical protein
MARVPPVVSTRRPPSSGLRPAITQTEITAKQDALRAVIDRLPEGDREFAASLAGARYPTTRQIFFIYSLIRRGQE